MEIKNLARIREIAPECAVLLKKDGSFPLSSPGKLAVFGNGVRNTVKGGTGSGDVNVRHFVTVEEGLRNAGFTLTSASWLDGYDAVCRQAKIEYYQEMKQEAEKRGMFYLLSAMGKAMPEPEYELPLEGEGEAAVYVLARISGEGSDRNACAGDMMLTETEKRDILELNRKYEKFMLVLNTGGLVDLTPVQEVKNILLLGQLGTPTGDVLADLILGKSYPSGKLAMTWAKLEDYPSTEGFGDPNDTFYREGIYVGYRYFDTVKKEVLYPFGYGLGYTEFETVCRSVSADESRIAVTAEITNTGKYAGRETVQLYYGALDSETDRPYKELAGFAKSRELLPGESCEVEIEFCTKDMAVYDEKSASYILEKGDYALYLGNSSRNSFVCGKLTFTDTVVTEQLKNICSGDRVEELCYERNEGDPKDIEQGEKLKEAACITIDTKKIEKSRILYSGLPAELPRGEACVWEDVISGKKSVEEFASGLSDDDLIQLCVGLHEEGSGAGSVIGVAASSVAGAAGETTDRLKEKYHLDTLVMADGPAGLRLSSIYKVIDGKVKAVSSSFGGDISDLVDLGEFDMSRKEETVSKEELEAAEYYQYCTAIPIGTDLAQSFNPEAVRACGDIVGSEMEQYGIHLWLAPALNIQRSPLCGRNFEYYSEDPLVSGLMAAAMTEGVQSHKGCGVTIKHFACNNQETNRYTSNSIVSERALREIYLRGFEICIRQAKPYTVMTSYNLINGEHACNRRELLTDVLRDEWNFEGIVMTDWYATTTVMKTPDSKYKEASAAGCVKAGNDLTMPGGTSDTDDIKNALAEEGHPYHLSRAQLQVCAVRILKLLKELVQK